MNKTEQLVQRTLRKVFADDTIVYDKSHFAGGLTNYNYIMTIHDKTYVIREPGVMTDRMLNRPVEQVNNVIASELGVNSVCVYFDQESGIKISEYIENGKTFAALDPCASDCVRAVAALLKTTHASPKVFSNVFDWEAELSKYERIVLDQNGQLFSDYPYLKEKLFQFIRQNVSSFESIPCHNDTVPENFLMNTVTGRPYLIDWEYSGMNEAMWDLSCLSIEAAFTEENDNALLTAYYERQATIGEKKRFIAAKLYVDYLWTLWGLTRVPYDGDFMQQYADERYARLKKNIDAYKKLS